MGGSAAGRNGDGAGDGQETVGKGAEGADDSKDSHVLPRRSVVERTFRWLNNYRRQSKDYEELPDTSEPLIYLAMSRFCCEGWREPIILNGKPIFQTVSREIYQEQAIKCMGPALEP